MKPGFGRIETTFRGGWISYWIAQNEVLFFGLYSEISGGQMPNKVNGAIDYLTVSGSVGSETYQCPNTAPYISADTDYIWFKTDVSQRIATTAELVGYDFSRTIVRYNNINPYNIEWIMILNSDHGLIKKNKMRDSFNLSIWWDDTFSFHGSIKGNRLSEKSRWAIEPIAPDILLDGNTIAWYDSQDLTSITKDSNNHVTRWNDKLLISTSDLSLFGGTPTWSIDGILFNGTTDYLKTMAFTLNQPEFIYIVVKQITWTNSDYFFDGVAAIRGALYQSGVFSNLVAIAGTGSPPNSNMSTNMWSIIRVLFNSASSKLIINETTPTTWNCGENNMGGITIGARGGGTTGWSNIQIKEMIVRKVADSSENENIIYNYLKTKFSL